MPRYRRLVPEDLDRGVAAERRQFGVEVLTGLSERPKRLPSRYFYDDEGSRLFQAITDCEDYYPTRCEAEILEREGADILAAAGTQDLVELGAGDGRKTRLLLRHLGAGSRYLPVDISEAAMRGLTEEMSEAFPHVGVEGVVAEYLDSVRWLARQGERRKLVLLLGSNIGNFSKAAARAFLRQLWDALHDGDFVLIGFDLKKDIEVLLRAYNDSAGITARFNLNLLGRINRELGGTFDLERFRHFATYDVATGAMTSYLVSLGDQDVHVADLSSSFHFDAWEPIHSEYSYKYLDGDVDALARTTGFEIVHNYYDERRWFLDSLWRVRKDGGP